MSAHDQLFKETLQAFFQEFFELFFPNIAARLDFSRVRFLDKEVFTDSPRGRRRELDLVAEVYTKDGKPELLLIHIEIERGRRRAFRKRFFQYYAMLRRKYNLPVLPIVLYLAPGAGGQVMETYEEQTFELMPVTFRYHAIGLPDLSADDYQALDNPLAPALSATMQPGQPGRLAQKLIVLQKLQATRVDEARKSLLLNMVETYLTLDAQEEAEFQRRLAQEEQREVREMFQTYEQRTLARGLEQGVVRGKRDSLLKLLRRKFGALPEGVAAKVEAVTTEAELDDLQERVVDAATLTDTGLFTQ